MEFEEFIPEDYQESNIVVSKVKEQHIKTISCSKMKELMLSRKLILHCDELDEVFVEFLQLSDQHDHLLLIKKFIRALKEVRLIWLNS
jgi:hypothetical protein